MRKAIIIASTILAAVAAGTVVVNAAQATTHTHAKTTSAAHPATGRLIVVERALTDTVVDTGPSGDSRGDLLAFANPIYGAHNKTRIGHDQGSCIRTVVGKAWECSWTVTLPKGSLVVQGPFYDTRDSVLAITGGTGRWARARGQMGLHARNAQGSSYKFSYHISH
jgi:allene oxide cyclase